MITRRRFIAISAAFAAGTQAARAQDAPLKWRGQAFGAEAEIELYGPKGHAEDILGQALEKLQDVEKLFSLFEPDSDINRLNQTGKLDPAGPAFLGLMAHIDLLHAATEGRFDPTVQGLWQAIAKGTDVEAARAVTGWTRVQHDKSSIHLLPGQALTFNGIAQGFATDRITDVFRKNGISRTVVNIGEFSVQGQTRSLGIADPEHGIVATRTIDNGAIATSSPGALALSDDYDHIIDPRKAEKPLWSTVAVEAKSATMADGLSTALCLADREAAERIAARLPGLGRVTLVDTQGDIVTL